MYHWHSMNLLPYSALYFGIINWRRSIGILMIKSCEVTVLGTSKTNKWAITLPHDIVTEEYSIPFDTSTKKLYYTPPKHS